MSLLYPPKRGKTSQPLSDRLRAYNTLRIDSPESSPHYSVPQVDSFDDFIPRVQPPLNEAARHPSLDPLHTRLFRILRTSPKLEVECRNFSLHELPQYVAVSHHWGQESATKVMSCNGHLLMVKPSLVECILDVSIFTQMEWFWLDAICINQDDEKEKAIQVPLLWKLFGDAESVLVYLGEADGYTKIAAAAFRQCAEKCLTRIPDAKLHAITTIWQKPWFSRLWTMQEAVLARNILFICGTYTISFDHLKYVHQLYATHGAPSVDAIISLRNWRQHNGEADAQYCGRILDLMVDQTCYLPVDRVFAVLGLFPQEIMSRVEVSYSRKRCREYWTTYEQFTQALSEFFSEREGSVNEEIRRLARATYSIPQLPTWCPNFNARRYHHGQS